MNGYILLAGLVQLAALAALASAIWHHAKYPSAIALGISVVVLSFSLDALAEGRLMTSDYLLRFMLAGGMSAFCTIAVTNLVVRRARSRSRQANARPSIPDTPGRKVA